MLRWGIVLSVAACTFHPGSSATGDAPGASDADGMVTGDGAGDATTMPPWGTPTFTGIGVGTDDPTLADDLLELYFNYLGDIYVAKRAAATDAWGAPALVTQLSSVSAETTPEVSYDGLTMLLASDRAGSQGTGGDLWISTRASRSAAWGTPALIPVLNTIYAEASSVMTPDKLAIVFTSYRKANLSPDVYTSTRAASSNTWGAPVEQTLLNTDMHEGSTFLTADKLTVYFDTDRDGGTGLDIYYSQRATPTDPFPAPQPMADINTPTTDEQDPWISSDGHHFFFYSDRGGTAGLWESVR